MQSVLKKACKLSSWYLQGFLVSFTEGTGSLIFIEIKMQKRDFLAAAEQRGGPPYTTPSHQQRPVACTPPPPSPILLAAASVLMLQRQGSFPCFKKSM